MPEGDPRAALGMLAAAGSDAVYVCASAEKNASAARALRQSLPQSVLLGNQSWYAPLAALAGEAANNAWFSMPVAPDDPGLAEIARAFVARFGDVPRPAVRAGLGRRGCDRGCSAQGGDVGPARIRDTLEQAASFKILQGQLDMDRRPTGPRPPGGDHADREWRLPHGGSEVRAPPATQVRRHTGSHSP